MVTDGFTIPRGPLSGTKWQRDVHTSFWYHTGRYEPETAGAILDLCRPGQVVWDLGANAGYHTLAAARAVGPLGQVIAVDAHPAMVALVRRQLALNDFDHRVIHAAIGDHNGDVDFIANDTNTLLSGRSGGRSITIPSLTLDGLLDLVPAPALVKMDIEGAETTAFTCAQRLLRQARPILLIAFHDDSGSRVVPILSRFGYQPSRRADRADGIAVFMPPTI